MSDPWEKHIEARVGASVAVTWGMATVSQCNLMDNIHNDGTGTSQAELSFTVAVSDGLAELGPPALGGVYMIVMHVEVR